MGNDFINLVNNLIKTVNDFSLIWSITSSKGPITLADGSIGTVNNFTMLFSMREKFQTPENWFRVENGFTLMNCLLTHTKLGQNHIKMKLVMFSTNSLFKAKLRLIYIFLGSIVLKTEPKRTSLLGLLSRWLTPSQNTKENF